MTYSELLNKVLDCDFECRYAVTGKCKGCPYENDDECATTFEKDKEKLRLIMHKLDEAIEEVAE